MKKIVLLLLCFVVFLPAAVADDAHKPSQVRTESYEFVAYWSGFEVGAMRLQTVESAKNFRYIADVEARGLVKLASKYKSLNVSSGLMENERALPVEYKSDWLRKGKGQKLHLKFSRNKDVIFEEQLPPEWKGKRPEVPQELKQGVFDPVSGGLVAYAQIKKALRGNSRDRIVMPIYDVKRRFDAEIEFLGLVESDFGGRQRAYNKIKLTRKPIAGFRDKELKEIQEDGGQIVYFYLDSNLLPIYAEAQAGMGNAVVKLVKYNGRAL